MGPFIIVNVTNHSLLGDHSLLPANQKFLSIAPYTAYPLSRGSIHIGSTSPYSHPLLDPSFLSHPADPPMLVWGYKVSREICRRMGCVVGEVASLHPAFPADSPAACRPVLADKERRSGVVYSPEDDAAIEKWVRATVRTAWHSLGTCAMRARADGGVVDKELAVYGVDRLMVADLSVAPENVGMYMLRGGRGDGG